MIMTMNCAVCGYGWTARCENPKECPQCKSRKWRFGGSNPPRVGTAREPEGNPVGKLAPSQVLQEFQEFGNRPECPECLIPLFENVKLRKYWCKCGHQEPIGARNERTA